MAQISFYDYPGFGERVRQATHYSQAVRIGDIVQVSGQGGWDPATGKCNETEYGKEVDQAFANVELALQKAGGKGWEQVYKLTVYVTNPFAEDPGHLVRNLRKYCPDHQPLLTGIGVSHLAIDNMHIEIEVAAFLGDWGRQ